jgi:hypothetical protein
MEFQTADILHCKGSRITSKLIKLFTNSSITHTAIIVIINGKICVLEMQKNGCELKTFENWKKEFNYKFIATRNPNNKITDSEILSMSGVKGYDFKSFIIKQPIKIIKSFITRKNIILKRDKNEDERFICSELIAFLCGWENPQNYTPIDVYNRCLSENNLIVCQEL